MFCGLFRVLRFRGVRENFIVIVLFSDIMLLYFLGVGI